MKRLIFTLALAAAALTGAQAQNEDLYDNDVYMETGTTEVKHNSFLMGIGAGSAFDINFRWNHQFGRFQYLTWDILSFGYQADYTKDYDDIDDWNERYSDGVSHTFKLTTGLRGFSPSFGNNMRVFAALNVGWGTELRDIQWRSDWRYDDEWEPDGNEWLQHAAIDFTIGLQFNKCYIGYGINSLVAGDCPNSIDHVVRLGVRF